jgi:hypothetical protein
MVLAVTAIQTNGMRDLYAVLGEERDGAAALRLRIGAPAPREEHSDEAISGGVCNWHERASLPHSSQ